MLCVCIAIASVGFPKKTIEIVEDNWNEKLSSLFVLSVESTARDLINTITVDSIILSNRMRDSRLYNCNRSAHTICVIFVYCRWYGSPVTGRDRSAPYHCLAFTFLCVFGWRCACRAHKAKCNASINRSRMLFAIINNTPKIPFEWHVCVSLSVCLRVWMCKRERTRTSVSHSPTQ